MNESEREVLYALCNGDITFSEASEKLGVSKEKIEEMLEDYSWVPSPERLAELVEMEMETILHIREISQPITFRVTQEQFEIRFLQMQFIDFVRFPNILYPIEYLHPPQENVVLNHTEDNGIAYIQ